ncbi:hypothetical protein EVAR_25032_1 [Eumeta japonica]|uniref:Uncharacterized protein n=1 Tax=Eumeta variegata TaxID=151549 RepID=A0A4C1V701_EUMVA|nr:hypothetical protein EVAR_25032_1 [Eumeta japonica]
MGFLPAPRVTHALWSRCGRSLPPLMTMRSCALHTLDHSTENISNRSTPSRKKTTIISAAWCGSCWERTIRIIKYFLWRNRDKDGIETAFVQSRGNSINWKIPVL